MGHLLCAAYTTKGGNTDGQVYRNNNGTLTQMGNNFVILTLNADNVALNNTNLVCRFGDEFYCCVGRGIYRYNPSTSNWDLTVVNMINQSDRGGSLYVGRGPTGAPRLVCIFAQSGTNMAVRKLDTPGGSWSSELLSGLGVPNTTGGHQGIVFNNRIHLSWATGFLVTYDFATDGFTVQNISGNIGVQPAGLVRAKSRVFALQNQGFATERTDLFEYIGGTYSIVISNDAVMPRATNSTNTSHGLMCHYDEASDSIIVHAYLNSEATQGTGWYVVQIPLTTMTPADITSTVHSGATSGLAAPSGPTPSGDARWVVEVDSEAAPTAPVTYLWLCFADGTWTRYRWNGVGSAITVLGSGGNRGIAMPHNPNGGGQYFYSGSTTASPGYYVEEVQARVALPGAVRVFLRGYQVDETGGSPTPTDETVGLYWGTTNQTPDNLATILNAAKVSGTGTNPTISANKINNFTFDGTTIYSVEWQASTDGLVDQELHTLMPHVEV